MGLPGPPDPHSRGSGPSPCPRRPRCVGTPRPPVGAYRDVDRLLDARAGPGPAGVAVPQTGWVDAHLGRVPLRESRPVSRPGTPGRGDEIADPRGDTPDRP